MAGNGGGGNFAGSTNGGNTVTIGDCVLTGWILAAIGLFVAFGQCYAGWKLHAKEPEMMYEGAIVGSVVNGGYGGYPQYSKGQVSEYI